MWLTKLSKRSGGIRTETVQQGHKNPAKRKNSFCWVIQLFMWALPHQHQPTAPFRSETATNLTRVYTDISRAIGKLSSLLLFMFVPTKLLLQLAPRKPPLHSMLSHFYRDDKNSHLSEPGLGRSLSRCFWDWRYPATAEVPLLWAAEAICLPRFPREVPRSVSNGVVT